MPYNPNLAEKPNHGHYPICLGRKTAIEKYCRKMFGYAFFSGIIMSVFTFFGMNFAVISWIPSMLGNSYEVSYIFSQLFIIMGIVFLSALGCGRLKIFNVIQLVLYLAIAVLSLFSDGAISRSCGFIIGAAGVLTCYKAPLAMIEYNQLMQTEGFPHFNVHFTEMEENRVYKSLHDRECYGDHADTSMLQPDAVEETAFTGGNTSSEMPGMPELMPLTPSVHEEKIFSPGKEKFCRISESPIKTI